MTRIINDLLRAVAPVMLVVIFGAENHRKELATAIAKLHAQALDALIVNAASVYQVHGVAVAT